MRRHIESVLAMTHGRIEGRRGTAALLKINPHTLRARMPEATGQVPVERVTCEGCRRARTDTAAAAVESSGPAVASREAQRSDDAIFPWINLSENTPCTNTWNCGA